jgi:hypothetical protein
MKCCARRKYEYNSAFTNEEAFSNQAWMASVIEDWRVFVVSTSATAALYRRKCVINRLCRHSSGY